jgi:outer membrane receptor protein involved in Fe transport
VFALVLFGLCLPANGSAQARAHAWRIRGTVTDPSGRGIPGALVKFQSAQFQATAITDAQGHFGLSGISKVSGTLHVSAAGFAPVTRPWQAGSQRVSVLGIILRLASVTQQVNVTATRLPLRVGETPASVVVLSQPVIESTPALSLDGVLRQIPDFTLYRRTDSRFANPTTQGVSLRGVGASGASRALVLADGIPLNDPFGGWVYWDRLPRVSVGRVEVAEGGASDLYGSDALGGVIGFVSRQAQNDVMDVDASYGNLNTPDGSLWANGVLGRWSAQLAAEAFSTDGYVLVPLNQRGAVDTPAGSAHRVSTLTIDRQLTAHSRVFLRGSIFAETRQNGTPVQTNRTHLRQLAAGWDWQSSQLGNFSARAFGGPELYDQNFSSITSNLSSESLTDVQRVPAQEAGGSFEWNRSAGTRQTLVAGLDLLQVRGASNEEHFSKGSPSQDTGSGGRQNTEGFYGEDLIRPASKWLITVGGRVDLWRNFDGLITTLPVSKPGPPSVIDYANRSETAFSPRLSILRTLNASSSLYVSGYRAFRAPTLNELYRSYRVGNVVTNSNSALTAERLTGAEAGAQWSPWHGRLNARASFFWSRIADPIANVTLITTPSLITQQRQNLGSTRSVGVELEAFARLTDRWTLSGGYQYAQATVTSFPVETALVGLWVPQVPRNVATFQATYSEPLSWTFALLGRYTGLQYDDVPNQFPLPSAFTLDAIVSRALGHRVELYAAAENLTADRYDIARVPYTEIGPPVLVRGGIRLHLGEK